MNKELLNPKVQSFIENNLKTSITRISLTKSPFKGVSSQELAAQIKGRKTAIEKLPTWSATHGIYYPPSLNLEQASSEALARHKAGLIKGKTLADLTGGFGAHTGRR